jgi:hypothetical protein
VLNVSRFSVVGDRAGELAATSVDARLSCRDDPRADLKR